jgi:hypothetical protein
MEKHCRTGQSYALHAEYQTQQTYSEYVILTAFYYNNICAEAIHTYILRILPLLLILTF